MARRRTTAPSASLFADDGPPAPETTTVHEDPYWFARTLSGMLLRGRSAIQGGPYPRADIESQLRETLQYWCRFADVDVPATPSTSL